MEVAPLDLGKVVRGIYYERHGTPFVTSLSYARTLDVTAGARKHMEDAGGFEVQRAVINPKGRNHGPGNNLSLRLHRGHVAEYTAAREAGMSSGDGYLSLFCCVGASTLLCPSKLVGIGFSARQPWPSPTAAVTNSPKRG